MARLINTGLSSAEASEILNAVIGQMSDGIWENSPRMESIWRGLSITRDPNTRELLISVNRPSELYEKDDQQVREYFANKIKQIIKIEIEDGNTSLEWDRNNRGSSDYLNYHLDIQGRDAYLVYDTLKQRRIRQQVTSNVPVSDIQVGDTLEKIGKVTAVQTVSMRNKKWYVIDGSYLTQPVLYAEEAVLRRKDT